MYYRFSQFIHPEIAVLAAVMPEHGGEGAVPATIEEFAAPFISLIKKQDQPVFMLGYSFGGYITYEIIRKLANKANIAGLILIGCPPPGVIKEIDYILAASDSDLYQYTLDCYQFDLNQLTPAEKHHYYTILRNDTQAMRHYLFPETALIIDSLILLGEKEEELELVNNIQQWSQYLTPVQYATIPGGHMLIKSYAQELALSVNQFITRRIGVNP